MSEASGEMAAPVEKESGAVRKMAERVGRFLSETYTFKGAKAKELRALDRVVTGFTPAQQQEMRTYYSAKAEKSAKWKVIRNWVATGAGLALGGAILANPQGAWLLAQKAGVLVAGWWKGAGIALGTAAEGIKTGLSNFGTGVKEWVFDTGTTYRIPVPATEIAAEATKIGNAATEPFRLAYNATRDSLQPLGEFFTKGPQIPLPVLEVK